MLDSLAWIFRVGAGLVQRLRTHRSTVPLPEGGSAVIRYRFLHFAGNAGTQRKQAVAASLCRLFQAVHRARQDLASLLAAMAGRGPEPFGVRQRIVRWFGGSERIDDASLVQAVLDVLMKVHRGMRDTVFLVESTLDESAIAYASGRALIRLGPRYWNEPRAERRMAGILYHELTHSLRRHRRQGGQCGRPRLHP